VIIISWNIQWGRGVDGQVDLGRIVRVARDMADFDVLCLQEVSDNYPGLAGAGSDNQFARLPTLLPGYHACEGVAVERFTPGIGRQRFGNMIFSRRPPVQLLRHQLPWPADAHNASMARMALEAVLETPGGAVRVMTTHLEYYAPGQRAAQLEALRQIQLEASGHAQAAALPQQRGKPFEARPRDSRAILCGDFNCDVADAQIAHFQRPLAGVPGWIDAWPLANPGRPHPKTVGLYDDAQWEGQHQSFDFFFVSADLAPQVRRVEVDGVTQASDHQPVLLEIDL
jgi:endonuclease/exonuclease/phosphatase family metal-dependent hydrolase